MKIYICSPQQPAATNGQSVELIAKAVRAAKLRDFVFQRDVKRSKNLEGGYDPWPQIRDELASCDSLLIDVSDRPGEANIAELGIAYAMRKNIIAIKKAGKIHDELIDSLASRVIEYNDEKDLTRKLKRYDDETVFGTTDTLIMLSILVLLGGFIGYWLMQFWFPLALVGPTVYWIVLRTLFVQIRAYDRLVIYIPLSVLWLGVFYVLRNEYVALSLAWLASFWVVVIIILKKLKLSL